MIKTFYTNIIQMRTLNFNKSYPIIIKNWILYILDFIEKKEILVLCPLGSNLYIKTKREIRVEQGKTNILYIKDIKKALEIYISCLRILKKLGS